MTLANVELRPDRVLVVTDTAVFGTGTGRPVCFNTKVTVLPHISAVVAFRGVKQLHRHADLYLNHGTFLPEGVDSAADGKCAAAGPN